MDIVDLDNLSSDKIQPLLDKRGREPLFLTTVFSVNSKYNRSSIKGDENPTLSLFYFLVIQKYNRSSIKGDENIRYLFLLCKFRLQIQPLLDKRGRELDNSCNCFFVHAKYNRSSIKGDENRKAWVSATFLIIKYNRSSIKGDEN